MTRFLLRNVADFEMTELLGSMKVTGERKGVNRIS
jgi:hypothetical protein